MNVDTKEREHFQVVYQERSMNQAAKKLFISPQGLGKIIRNLEGEFHETIRKFDHYIRRQAQ